MLKACRNTYINYIQCKMGDYASTATDMIEYGSCDVKDRMKNLKVLNAYLRLLRCHQSLAFAYLIVLKDQTYINPTGVSFTIGSGEQQLTIFSLFVLPVTYTATEFAAAMAVQYNTQYDHIHTITSGRYMLIYSFEDLWDDTITITAGSTNIAENRDAVVTDAIMADVVYENCLTETEICDIINHAMSIADNMITNSRCLTC